MTGWVGDIAALTVDNTTFRTVLYTAAHLQLTVMCLQPGEEIGLEMHDQHDQFIRIEAGQARITVGPQRGPDRGRPRGRRRLGDDHSRPASGTT